MKIKVNDLEPNPFRDLKRYKFNTEKLAALKASISETSFWDNILVRKAPRNGKYQIAYGHHRLEVLRILKIKEVDIPVRQLDDATMLKIMANENMDDWSQSPAIINETVRVTKEFLDAELAKCDYATSGKSTRGLFDSKKAYDTARGMGVGRETILNFLGGAWSENKIRQALETLQGMEVKDHDSSGKAIKRKVAFDRKAVESMGTTEKVSQFKRAVADYKIPKAKQEEIAKKVNRPGIGSRDIRREVSKVVVKGRVPKKSKVDELSGDMTHIETLMQQLSGAILKFNAEMQKLGVREVKGMQVLFVKQRFSRCLQAMKKMYALFGYKID